MCHSPSPDKRKLFCLFVYRGTLSYYGLGAFSLPIPHGMHLVVTTQFCFFWVVCHPSRTLPPKKPEQEPQNRSFPSPHHQTMLFYLWRMTSLCPVFAGYRLVRFGPCACLSSMYVQNLPAAHALPWLACTVCRPFFTIFWFSFPLWLALPRDWALLDSGLCFSLAHPFSCYHLLPYHSIIFAAKLFALILLGLFEPAVYYSPNGPVWPLVLLLHH